MTLQELLSIANSGYSDEVLSLPINGETDDGDTLALFVVREISETYDPDADTDDQLREAVRVLERATEDLDRTIQALSRGRWT